MEPMERPFEMRRGWLRSGNTPGDLSKAATCGARTRRGNACQCPAMRNGRCRLHGGLSTGPKTAEGLERLRRAVTRHGRYSRAAHDDRNSLRELLRECREYLATLGPSRGELS